MSIHVWKCPFPDVTVEVLASTPELFDALVTAPQDTTVLSTPLKKRLMLCHTGNPGLVMFYKKFATILATQHDTDVLFIGFAGHSMQDYNNGRVFYLQDQIDVAQAFASAVLSRPSVLSHYGKNIYSAAHSIGAFVASHIVARFPCIQRFFSLCGVFGHIAVAPSFSRIFFLASHPLIAWGVAHTVALIGILPISLKRIVLAHESKDMTAEMAGELSIALHRSTLLNIAGMTMSEVRQAVDIDVELLRSIQERMVYFCVENDGWAPQWCIDEIKDALPKMAGFVHLEGTEVSHAWCLKSAETVVERGIVPYFLKSS